MSKKIKVSDQTFERLKRMKQFTDGRELWNDRPFSSERTYDHLLRWMLRKVEPI